MTSAIQWGVKNEALAIQIYSQHQQIHSRGRLTVCKVGFQVSRSHPFLGVSPDGGVYDPSCDQPYVSVEVKCPYSILTIHQLKFAPIASSSAHLKVVK